MAGYLATLVMAPAAALAHPACPAPDLPPAALAAPAAADQQEGTAAVCLSLRQEPLLPRLWPAQQLLLPQGHLMMRSVAMAFDAYIGAEQKGRFSRTV